MESIGRARLIGRQAADDGEIGGSCKPGYIDRSLRVDLQRGAVIPVVAGKIGRIDQCGSLRIQFDDECIAGTGRGRAALIAGKAADDRKVGRICRAGRVEIAVGVERDAVDLLTAAARYVGRILQHRIDD